jgi:predicted nucleic acid-binding protein
MSLFLVDTSAWARIGQVSVGRQIAEAVEANAVVLTEPIVLELLRSARSGRELAELNDAYDALHWVHLTPEIARRAREVQAALASRGHHRGPSPVDLLAAAAAESVQAEVWHCDRHFELIAAVTGQRQGRLDK